MESLTFETAKFHIDSVLDEIEKVILGKRKKIQLTLTALIAGGHVVFEDVPGVGKTLLVKALAKTIHADFKRIQFTPDLLPNDIIGISIYNNQTNKFEFRPGPIFTTVLLADEINRTTPRSQSALLQAMAEKTITVDGTTYQLSDHFFVLATENPIEYAGTYPLPEAQLDRFLFRLKLGYPNPEEEMAIMLGAGRESYLKDVHRILSTDDLTKLKSLADSVYIDGKLAAYALTLVQATRMHNDIRLGVSPRGAAAFVQAAKSYALTEGRSYCIPDDFLTVLEPVFSHRIILKQAGNEQKKKIKRILDEIKKHADIPVKG